MNWFQNLITNANAHNLGAAGLLLTGLLFPEFVPLAKAAGGAIGLALSGAALPGGSILGGTTAPTPIATPVINLPPAQAGGSYHAVDYVNLATQVLNQLAKPADPAGRS